MEPRYPGGDDALGRAPHPSRWTDALGPAPIVADSWEADSWEVDEAWADAASWQDDHIDENARYRGRRRAAIVVTRYRWWLGGVAVLIALVAVVVLAVRPAPGPDSAAPLWSAPPGDGTGPSPLPEASAAPSPSPGPSATPTTNPSGQPAFAAVTVEAEAGSPATTLSGSASVASDPRASGGRVVTGLGDRGGGQAPGTLQISGLSLPSAGTYRIAIYYINDQGHGRRSALIIVSGADPMTLSFTGAPKCCDIRTLQLRLAAGVHTITVSNPSAPAPAIDKIVVSRA